MQTSQASWFNDYGASGGGPPACGFHAALGFANRSLPCHARVLFCAARCVIGVKQDAGPYSGDREFDLTPRLRDAIGFGDVGPVRWRRVG